MKPYYQDDAQAEYVRSMEESLAALRKKRLPKFPERCRILSQRYNEELERLLASGK